MKRLLKAMKESLKVVGSLLLIGVIIVACVLLCKYLLGMYPLLAVGVGILVAVFMILTLIFYLNEL